MQGEAGQIKIHKNVIASIASLAAAEIEGVKAVGGDFRSGLFELMGKKFLWAVGVEVNKNEEVRVKIPLVIKYGYNIPEVANKVQENARISLEKMTNLSIKEINVNIQGIEK
ncbi:MAG: Asp23/Gls24 family envelope stress response protein [Candidatus Omnitrophota bacterium]|nr:Asp23/Gls24 family envelope stress response protein [Candidatus Omnitrophota bacterium]